MQWCLFGHHCPTEIRLFLKKKDSKGTALKTDCLLSKLLSEIKGNLFPAESGYQCIANDEMTMMSVNWMFRANKMRGCDMWKANRL